MEQLWLYVVLLCGVTAVLSLVTLHKMKKLSEQMQRIIDNEEHMLIQLTSRPPEPVAEQPMEQYKPEELIDAVLGEVFP